MGTNERDRSGRQAELKRTMRKLTRAARRRTEHRPSERGLAGRILVRVGSTTLLAALLWTGGLAAQESRSERIREALPEAVAAEIEALILEARQAGVPSAPLYNKALEGAAKRVPPPRIVAAVRDYATRLQHAQELMGGTREAAWVVAGADALRRGVTAEALQSMGDRAGERTPMALVVMGDLVEAGVPTDRALEVVREALARTRTEGGLLDLPLTLRRLVREGALAPDAARRVLGAMRDGIPLRRLRHRTGGRVPDRVQSRPVPPGSEPTRDVLRSRDGFGSARRSLDGRTGQKTVRRAPVRGG